MVAVEVVCCCCRCCCGGTTTVLDKGGPLEPLLETEVLEYAAQKECKEQGDRGPHDDWRIDERTRKVRHVFFLMCFVAGDVRKVFEVQSFG